MIVPQYLEKLDSLVSSSTLRLIKNAARMFLIRQVWLQLNHIMFHFADRILEAASELRHVEYIMNLGEVWWQLQLLSHGSTSGDNRERADVARS